MRLADPTKLARHAAAIRAASLITNEPSVDIRSEDLRRQHLPTASRAIARQRPSSSDRDCMEDGRYVSAPPGPRGRGRGLTDRTLLVSGDAWARAAASVTASGWARER